MNKQTGQVAIILIAFIAVLTTIFSFSYNTYRETTNPNISSGAANTPVYSASSGCQRYTGPPVIYRGPSYQTTDNTLGPAAQIGTYLNLDSPTDYQLAIAQVPVDLRFLSPQNNFSSTNPAIVHLPGGKTSRAYEIKRIGTRKYAVIYPREHGEIHAGTQNAMSGLKAAVSTYKVVFLIYLDENDTAIKVKAVNDGRGQVNLMTDVYQDPTSPPIPDLAIDVCQGKIGGPSTEDSGIPEPTDPEADALQSAVANQQLSITTPTQTISPDKLQLQLQYFLFQATSSAIVVNGAIGAWNIHCKPAIYLYPTQPTNVNVKVNTKGFLTYTDPLYPEGGWNVLAQPSGQLTDLTSHSYDYLYYESKVPDKLINKPTQGFTVEYNQLTNLYTYLLPKLGLNATQTKDFSDYWQKALPYSTYYFVGIMDQKEIDAIEPLDITPKPDTNIRVRLYFQALEQKPTLGLNDFTKPLPKTPQKNGFSMVEWGGMVKLDKSHPFTCSQ